MDGYYTYAYASSPYNHGCGLMLPNSADLLYSLKSRCIEKVFRLKINNYFTKT